MKTLEELAAIRERMKDTVRTRDDSHEGKTRVLVGLATCGIAAGARPVLAACTEEVAKKDLHNVFISQTGCIGICQYEPVVEVISPAGEKTTYVKMTPEKMKEVVDQHLSGGKPIAQYTIGAAQNAK